MIPTTPSGWTSTRADAGQVAQLAMRQSDFIHERR